MGVLVAISIPIFTSQLEKSREAVDLANIRSAYAQVQAAALTQADTSTESGVTVTKAGNEGSYTWTTTVDLKQTQEGWQGTVDTIGGVDISSTTPKATGTCEVKYDQSTGTTTFTFS